MGKIPVFLGPEKKVYWNIDAFPNWKIQEQLNESNKIYPIEKVQRVVHI